MELRRLKLKNFRNHGDREFEFCGGVNVICGENGVGKTNVLEAIHLLATSKSHRGVGEREMVLWGEEFASVNAEFMARERDNTAAAKLAATRRKQFVKNGVGVQKTSDLMGFLSVVMFAPDDLQIIKGAPQARRRMLDLAICQMSKKYFHLLSAYGRVLMQKNRLLKSGLEGAKVIAAIEPWNAQMAIYGAQIGSYRARYIDEIQRPASEKFRGIMERDLEVRYVGVGAGCEKLGEELERVLEKEVRYRQALVGPHRDDFEVSIGGADARVYASQGQQRAAIICLKMAQVAVLGEKSGELPILLLDDVMSELDEVRRRFILEHASGGGQTILTTTGWKFSDDLRIDNVVDL